LTFNSPEYALMKKSTVITYANVIENIQHARCVYCRLSIKRSSIQQNRNPLVMAICEIWFACKR
jgi:hypothetical protein